MVVLAIFGNIYNLCTTQIDKKALFTCFIHLVFTVVYIIVVENCVKNVKNYENI